MLKLINSAVNLIKEPKAIKKDAKIKMRGINLSLNCPIIVKYSNIIIGINNLYSIEVIGLAKINTIPTNR